jgi:uncharacterized membrane protein YtjA (UPF0391 family)
VLKYAVFFLVLSLIAGVLGLTNVSRVAKRISLVLFALLFLVFPRADRLCLSPQRGHGRPCLGGGGGDFGVNTA